MPTFLSSRTRGSLLGVAVLPLALLGCQLDIDELRSPSVPVPPTGGGSGSSTSGVLPPLQDLAGKIVFCERFLADDRRAEHAALAEAIRVRWSTATAGFLTWTPGGPGGERACAPDQSYANQRLVVFTDEGDNCALLRKDSSSTIQNIRDNHFSVVACGGSNPTTPTWQALHTMGHLLGLSHVQERRDRDRFLRFAPGNCLPCRADVSTAVSDVAASCDLPSSSDGDFGPFNYRSIMLHPGLGSSGSTDRCGLPDLTCTLTTGDHGDRTYVRSVPDADRPDTGCPCADDVCPSLTEDRIGSEDGGWVVELCRTQARWTRFIPLGHSLDPTQPLTRELTAGVDPRGAPAIANVETPYGAVMGSDRHVYSRWIDEARWFLVPGDIALRGDPAVTSWSQSDERVDIVAFTDGAETRIAKKAYYDGSWEPGDWDTSIGAPPEVGLNASTTPGPAITSSCAGCLDVAVRGADGSLWLKQYVKDGGGWQSWRRVVTSDGAAVSIQSGTRPAIASRRGGAGKVEIVVRAPDGELVLVHNVTSLSFQRLTIGQAGDAGEGSPALAASSGLASNGLDVFVRGVGNQFLWHKRCRVMGDEAGRTACDLATPSFENLGSYLGREGVTGPTTSGDPAAAVSASGELHVLAFLRDENLWWKRYTAP